MQPYLRRAERRALRTLAVCLAAATCARDVPVAPTPASDPATEQLTSLATAVTDAQQWLLPSPGERDVATDAIAGRFEDLATSLARADTSAFVGRIAAARQELGAGTAGQSGEQFIQLAALALVLDDVEAVIQGRLRLVPFEQAVPDSPQDASRAANERKRPTLERNLP